VVVIYLPYQELETSDGFPCTIDPVDPVDYARAHDRDSVYGVRFSSLSRSIPGYIPNLASFSTGQSTLLQRAAGSYCIHQDSLARS
jgi:hypothetical protein